MEDLAGMTDSLDFENSDDLNKIIQKYENLLGSANKDSTPSKDPLSPDKTENITP